MTTETMTETYKQLNDSFNQAMRTGSQFHEQTARFWNEAMTRNLSETRAQFEKVADDALPFNKKNIDRFHRMFDENAKRSLDLLKQTMDVGTAHNMPEAYDKLMSLWRNSFESLRECTDAVARANAEMFETWTGLMRQGFANGKTPAADAAQKRPTK